MPAVIQIRTPYSRTVVNEIGEIPHARWDGHRRLWTVPYRSFEELRRRWPAIETAAERSEPEARRVRREAIEGTAEDEASKARIAENKVAFLSRDDVAAAAADALATDGHAGAIYNLTGPQALSGAERTEAISKAAGKPYGFALISEDELRSGLAGAGLPKFVIDAVVSMKVIQAEGAYDIVTGDVERLTGTPPKSLSIVLASEFA